MSIKITKIYRFFPITKCFTRFLFPLPKNALFHFRKITFSLLKISPYLCGVKKISSSDYETSRNSKTGFAL